MLRGEKTSLFWIGLTILSLASVFLFSVVWGIRSYLSLPYNLQDYVENSTPVIVGAIVFILVGFCMTKSGIKKNPPS